MIFFHSSKAPLECVSEIFNLTDMKMCKQNLIWISGNFSNGHISEGKKLLSIHQCQNSRIVEGFHPLRNSQNLPLFLLGYQLKLFLHYKVQLFWFCSQLLCLIAINECCQGQKAKIKSWLNWTYRLFLIWKLKSLKVSHQDLHHLIEMWVLPWTKDKTQIMIELAARSSVTIQIPDTPLEGA